MKVNTKPRKSTRGRDEDNIFYQEMTEKGITHRDKLAIKRKEEFINKNTLNK